MSSAPAPRSASQDRQAVIEFLHGKGWVHRYTIADAFPHLRYGQLGQDLRTLERKGLLVKQQTDVPGRKHPRTNSSHCFPTNEYRLTDKAGE